MLGIGKKLVLRCFLDFPMAILAKKCKKSENLKIVQTLPNASERVQMHPKGSEWFRMGPNGSEHV